jgi:hypothetical protein
MCPLPKQSWLETLLLPCSPLDINSLPAYHHASCRDLSSPFVCELEALLEGLNPDYCRASRQHNPPAWTNALTDGV